MKSMLFRAEVECTRSENIHISSNVVKLGGAVRSPSAVVFAGRIYVRYSECFGAKFTK